MGRIKKDNRRFFIFVLVVVAIVCFKQFSKKRIIDKMMKDEMLKEEYGIETREDAESIYEDFNSRD